MDDCNFVPGPEVEYTARIRVIYHNIVLMTLSLPTLISLIKYSTIYYTLAACRATTSATQGRAHNERKFSTMWRYCRESEGLSPCAAVVFSFSLSPLRISTVQTVYNHLSCPLRCVTLK